MDPPEFEIIGFTDHVSVNVKFQSVAPKMLNEEELQFYLALIEEQSGGIVKKVSGQNSPELAMNTLPKKKKICNDLNNYN